MAEPVGAPTPRPEQPGAAAAAPLSGEPEKPAADRSTGLPIEVETPGLLSDCRLMLSYARKNSFILSAELIREIAWLDSVLKAAGISPISLITSRLITGVAASKSEPRFRTKNPFAHVGPAAATEAAQTGPGDDVASVRPAVHGTAVSEGAAPAARDDELSAEEVILDVHSQLSQLIRPTTALSLQTSEPPSGRRHIFGGIPPLVQFVIVVALVSAFGFVVSASVIANRAAVAAPKAASGAAS